jgi:hypothetical protein
VPPICLYSAAGGLALALPDDVRDEDEVSDRTKPWRFFGGIDIVVNNTPGRQTEATRAVRRARRLRCHRMRNMGF